jgi:hypothetical protein
MAWPVPKSRDRNCADRIFFYFSSPGVALITAFRSGRIVSLRLLRNPKLLSFALIVTLLNGCGGTSHPQIGPIAFTNASGASVPAVTSLAVNGQVYLVATVTNDNELLGVSWTVTCGSAVPPGGSSIDSSCGSFNPTQTASGPVPLYQSTGIVTTYNAPPIIPKGMTVTITAHATALPSVTSSVALTIVQ